MSGAVGMPRDIGVTKEEAHEPADINKTTLKTTVKPPNCGYFFTFRQLNALALIIIISDGSLHIFHGILEGDKVGITGAAPRVFLLASQVFFEGLTSAGGISLPILVFMHVLFNKRRILTIVKWLRVEISKVGAAEYNGSSRKVQIGRPLAVANMFYWCLDLFGFLLPVFLPKAFKI
ncbi:uncharacterized protein Fot_03382 [Forsythia ovata]|uniref:DUF7733 domain-containing protein n=1 Tax=Forsythia ovata TaxID=205694 RepID=A0ABD1X9K3_9LAMI